MDIQRSGVSRKRKRISGRAILGIVLAVSFFVALGIYFARAVITTERENAVYTSMEEPTLPVIYAMCGDMEINPMHGHFEDMGNTCADMVTILPASRKLQIHIKTYAANISGLSYQVRNLSMDHFIEKTEVTEIRKDGEDIFAVLPIQNLIEKESLYLLTIQLDIGEREANYYTKILWTDREDYPEMLRLAADFSAKTFDPEASRDLTQYLETDPKEKNDDLGRVSIGSAFSQLTWAESDMKRASVPEIILKLCDGSMAAIEVAYLTAITDAAGEERFYTREEFTMRNGGDRIYMMGYERTVNEIFDGSKHRFSGKKIMLGISDGSDLLTKSSENGRYIVYKIDKELWMYDQEGQTAVNLFSFRSATDDGVRSGFRNHDMKPLSVSDSGVIDFVVYGYMNRGEHEGYSGITYYRYDAEADILSEILFVPIANTYERIALELDELSAAGNRMYFFKQGDALTGVDLNSLETMSLVSGLGIGTFVSNPANTRAAWVENGKYGSTSLKMMNVEEGTTTTYNGNGSDLLIPLGYIGDDLVVGHAREEDRWYSGTREKGFPMYMLEILDKDGNQALSYKRRALWIDNVTITEGRILFDLYEEAWDGRSYRLSGTDTIVQKERDTYSDASLAGTTKSGNKQTVWYISITNELKNTKKLKVKAPESISTENSGNVELRLQDKNDELVLFTYANGRLTGRADTFKNSLAGFYDQMGWVTDKNGSTVLSRTNKGSYHTIPEPFVAAQPLLNGLENFSSDALTGDGYLLLDADGLDLNVVLGFVYKDCPVAVSNDSGKYYLIYGYNKDDVKLYYPTEYEESVTETIPREEAEQMIKDRGYAYMCFTPVGK